MSILTSLIFFTLSIISPPHDIHVSVMDIDIDDSSIDITIKTFLDDLQIACGLTPGAPVPERYSSAEEMIAEYLHKHLAITAQDSTLSLHVSDISAAQDAVWIELKTKSHNSDLTIDYSLLTDVYDDQKNIVNIRRKGKKWSKILDGASVSWDVSTTK